MLAALKRVITREPQPRPIVLANAKQVSRYTKAVKAAGAVPVVDMLEYEMLPMTKAVHAAGLGYYNLSEVERYLNKIKPQFTTIVWRAVTIESAKIFDKYQRLIPVEALDHIKKISDGSNEPLDFFVSDYQEVYPDPFLAVSMVKHRVQSSLRGHNPRDIRSFRVVFHWDEPGFGKI